MRLSGSPSNRSRNIADQFDDARRSWQAAAARSPMPARVMISAQLPSEPSRGQLAPPSASTVASARTSMRPDGVSNVERAIVVPTGPAVARLEHNARRVEPLEPGAQQRRRFQALRKHPPAGADKRLLPQALAPRRAACRAETPRWHRADAAARHHSVRGSVERFAVREVEPAAAGEQEFPPGRRHAVVERDLRRRPCAGTRPPSVRQGPRRRRRR